MEGYHPKGPDTSKGLTPPNCSYITRCKELIKIEHANWIGLTNQDAIAGVLSELETYKRQNKIKDEYLHLLIDLGFDYDGLNTVESLKDLIDDLIDYAKLALKNNDKEFVFLGGDEKKYNILREEIEVEKDES